MHETKLPLLNVVKIDTEGAEYTVLKGILAAIQKLQPRLIGIEIRGYLLQEAGVDENQLRELIHHAGYHLSEAGNLDGNFLFARE